MSVGKRRTLDQDHRAVIYSGFFQVYFYCFITYSKCVSFFEKIDKTKDAVSPGFSVHGTIRYSPGSSLKNFITSLSHTKPSVCATGSLSMKNSDENLPL